METLGGELLSAFSGSLGLGAAWLSQGTGAVIAIIVAGTALIVLEEWDD